ncbi:MAG TPA: hypothetical protein VE733_13430 [Streptosporangiaceae bacterium]|nr:hypothetical protein [Streptosporangiaceae bacterium]
MTIPLATWRESCSCPGAARQEREDQARMEAFQAVRARGAGRSQEEIRELYIAELRSRGLDIPPEEALNAGVAAVTGNYFPSARLLGRSLADVAKLIGRVFGPSR